jgi:hypothetical protein
MGERGGGFERREVGEADGDLCVDKSVEREEKKERWRFQMSMKLEKIDVRDPRSNNGRRVSRDAMIGVRKSWTSS